MRKYILIALSIFCIQTLSAQQKCYNNHLDETYNHIKGLNVQRVDSQGFTTFLYHVATSSSKNLFNYTVPSVHEMSVVTSSNQSQNSQPTFYTTNTINSIVSQDTANILYCHAPYNFIQDSSFCLPGGSVPGAYSTALMTISSEEKSFFRLPINVPDTVNTYSIHVPKNGFYLAGNLKLKDSILLANGTYSNLQFKYRPVVLDYLKKGMTNIGSGIESEGVVYCKLYQPYVLRLGYYDDDGDSVSMIPIVPQAIKISDNYNFTPNQLSLNDVGSMTYQAGFSLAQPFNVTNYSYSSLNQELIFTPQVQGFFQLCFEVKEYRSGSLISSSQKLIGVCVSPEVSEQPKFSNIRNVTGSFYSGNNRIYACAGGHLSFDISLKNDSANGIFILNKYSHGFKNSTPVSNYTFFSNDSLVLHFDYVSNNSDNGWKYIVLETENNLCNIESGLPSKNFITIPIYFFGTIPNVNVKNYTICEGDSVQLYGPSSQYYQWAVISGDASSLSCLSCQSPIAHPNVTSKYIVFPSISGIGCINAVDTFEVKVNPLFQLSIDADLYLCSKSRYTLLKALVTPSLFNMNVTWTPANLCVPPNALNTTVYCPVDTNWYYVTVSDDKGCSTQKDSVKIIYQYFDPKASIDKNKICSQDTIVGTASGGGSYQWAYAPSAGTYMSCNTCSQSEIVPKTSGVVSVDVSEGQCKERFNFPIEILESPIANAGNDTMYIYDGYVYIMDGSKSENAISFNWEPPNYLWNPTSEITKGFKLPDEMLYILTVSNGYCEDKDTVFIKNIPCLSVPLPNAFVPKHGYESYFKPNNCHPGTHVKMKIFNRWGLMIYEEENNADKLRGWDGTYKSEDQPIETYCYLIDVDCYDLDGNFRTYHLTGTVMLVR